MRNNNNILKFPIDVFYLTDGDYHIISTTHEEKKIRLTFEHKETFRVSMKSNSNSHPYEVNVLFSQQSNLFC